MSHIYVLNEVALFRLKILMRISKMKDGKGNSDKSKVGGPPNAYGLSLLGSLLGMVGV